MGEHERLHHTQTDILHSKPQMWISWLSCWTIPGSMKVINIYALGFVNVSTNFQSVQRLLRIFQSIPKAADWCWHPTLQLRKGHFELLPVCLVILPSCFKARINAPHTPEFRYTATLSKLLTQLRSEQTTCQRCLKEEQLASVVHLLGEGNCRGNSTNGLFKQRLSWI